MKIAIVYDMIWPFNIGGTEKRNYEIAKRLASKGHEVHLFGIKLWQGPDIIKKEGIIIHGVCRYKNKCNFSGKRSILETLKFGFFIMKELRKEKFDIIEASSFPYLHLLGCKFVSLINKTPLVFVWLQYWDNYWFSYLGKIKGFFGKIIEKQSVKLTKNHIAISKTTKIDVEKIIGKKDSVFLNYCGVDLKEIKKASNSKEKFDILYVGRLNHQKNLCLLINACAILKKDLPNIKIGIIGDGPDKNQLVNLAKRNRLTKNIIFKGFVRESEKVYGFMKSSKIFVLPSILEGLGIVIIEAHACGLSTLVINNKWNASKELINKNGLIVKEDAKALADAMKTLLKDNKLRNNMSKNGIKNAIAFNWDKLTEELEEHYEAIIHGN